MKLTFQDLLAPVTLPGSGDPLQAWRWRIGADATPWLVTALGDVFVKTADGRISFLDTYVGELSEAAAANTAWTRALHSPGNLDQWFDPSLVSALRRRGLTLGPEQCYAPIEPLILGGPMEPENFEVTEWLVHVGLLGRMLEKAKGLTAGDPS
ncbi:MAG TPA: T6SS immunity protein Tdi1 domain-containing protein [Vicinamibacteria bacterium]|nr:T6SS immunity protein Tdi1 domain-containing protein [Vicinamibacteria bacterium]